MSMSRRLETRSEYITPSRPTFADGGHLKCRVRSEAKRHDSPGAQPSNSISFDHMQSPIYPLNHQHFLACRAAGYHGILGSVLRGSVALLTPVADPYCPSSDPT